jgi:HEAT repeat protein
MAMCYPSPRAVARIACLSFLLFLNPGRGPLFAAPAAESIQVATVRTLISQGNVTALRGLGTGVLPVMIQLYGAAGESERASIAAAFYGLGWKSPDAKRVLAQDVHTANQALRIQVQYALGRVSSDADVVDVLLDNMQNDANPLFRDKAACALAYDQIHLTEREKVRLYDGLIAALSDPKLDVRSIAALALSIQTGQTKSFDANGTFAQREASIREWRKWLNEYRSRW